MRIAGSIPAVLLLALAAACGGSSSSSSPSNTNTGGGSAPTCTAANAVATTTVTMSQMEFSPTCIKVPVNTAVTFDNTDPLDHTVTTDAGQPESFDSGLVAPNRTFTHTFATAGTIKYHCKIHAGMVGAVVVE